MYVQGWEQPPLLWLLPRITLPDSPVSETNSVFTHLLAEVFQVPPFLAGLHCCPEAAPGVASSSELSGTGAGLFSLIPRSDRWSRSRCAGLVPCLCSVAQWLLKTLWGTVTSGSLLALRPPSPGSASSGVTHSPFEGSHRC